MTAMRTGPAFVPEYVSPPERGPRYEALAERNNRLLSQGKEPSIEQKRELVAALRAKSLDDIVELERLRAQRGNILEHNLKSLDLMVHARAAPLDPIQAHDVDVFLRMPTILSDEAVTAIALLEALADAERDLDRDSKASPEEQRRRAAARRQHLEVLKDEWGVN